MNCPEVTIILPMYNGAAYLLETLDSLLSQTFTNFELLVIDDGSTDDSVDLVRSVNDHRIRLIYKENGGLCSALNRGIAEAEAPYIARTDQDDISFPERIERQLKIMSERPEAISLFAYNTKFGAKHRWSNSDKLIVAPGVIREYEPLKDGCLLGSTMFARTAVLKSVQGFRQAYYPVDDWDLECRLSQTGMVLVLCEPLVAYRFQAMANTYRMFTQMQEISRWTADSYRRRLQDIPELTLDQFLMSQPTDILSRWDRYRVDSAKLMMRTAGQSYLDGQYLAAAIRLSTAILLNPGDIVKRAKRSVFRRPDITTV